jgi:hypothetical protein
MATNGNRRPPKPRIEMLSDASETDTAAIVAALERFLAETAPAPAAADRQSPWQRTALREGVSRSVELAWGPRSG